MIPFAIEKLSVEHVELKSVTTALGGSISVLDEEKTAATGKEVFTKVKVPLAVARKFILQHEVSKYLKPVLTAVTMYDGHAVALERHPLGNMGEEVVEGLNGQVHWISESEKNLDGFILNTTRNGEWHTDGTFVYQFTNDNHTVLSSDKKFRALPVSAIKFANVIGNEMSIDDRACLAFYSSNGRHAISPPIWKNLEGVGAQQLTRVDDDSETDVDYGEDDSDFQFDRVDQFLSVNLGFALKAAKELSDVFGYDVIEPLALDDLMIQLHTVNLPKVSKHIKRTFDTGMKFTHAVAWLIGLTDRTETLESYKVLRSVLKYLTTKGVYRKTAFNPDAVYHKDKNMNSVPLMTKEEALEGSTGTLFPSMRKAEVTGNVVGTLYGAE